MKNSEGRMNRAEESIHKESADRPHPRSAGIGGQHSDVKGTQEGGPSAEARGTPGIGSTHLGHAMHELHRQHPEHHMDRGPHHGGHEHIRHEPLGGLRPAKRESSEHGRFERRHKEHMKHGK